MRFLSQGEDKIRSQESSEQSQQRCNRLRVDIFALNRVEGDIKVVALQGGGGNHTRIEWIVDADQSGVGEPTVVSSEPIHLPKIIGR